MRPVARILVVLSLLAGSAASAQITETAVAFDSAGKIRTLTPPIVARLQLGAPAWPVSGEFVEARLFAVSSGGHVLVVERAAGRLERYPMSADHAAALRFAIDNATATSGSPVSETTADVESQPARGSFVRNQMALTWGLYGPLLAALADDPKAGTALILLGTGASYFVSTALSRKTVVTRAQNHLSTDGAFRGMGLGMGTLLVIAGDDAGGRAYAGAGLVGALTGQVAGFNLGKRLTDGEAEATTAISTYAAATALGLTGASGLIDEESDARAAVGAIMAAGGIGYALGARYPRRARYTVTRGDIQILATGAILGIGAGATPFINDDFDYRGFFASTTVGMLAGLYLAERNWVRPYDHATREAAETGLGMGAGALMGAGIGVLSDAGAQMMIGLMTGGGVLGALVAHNMANPQRASARISDRGRGPGPRLRLSVSPADVALGVAGVPGRYSILQLSF
jgi:hypothetical protein